MKNNKLFYMFRDRLEAGFLLAEELQNYKNEPAVVLAVPRGGVPVAYAVALQLGLPVEIILTKKIGHPTNKEYAIGAASLTDHFVIPHDNVSEAYIQEELKNIRTRLAEMQTRFMGDKEPENLSGKTVIIIDDGIATGNTMLGTIRLLRKKNPGKIVIAVPVASENAVNKLSKEADDVVAVYIPHSFSGVGAFYEDFEQVSDIEVKFYLDKLRALKKTG